MKSLFCGRAAYVSVVLLGMLLSMVCIVGCSSKKAEEKPGDDLNSAMSAQQKATIQQRKQQEGQ